MDRTTQLQATNIRSNSLPEPQSWNFKITALGLNKNGATGILAHDAGTQLGEAQERIRGLVEDGATGMLASETTTQLGAAQDAISYKHQEPNLAFTYPLKKEK